MQGQVANFSREARNSYFMENLLTYKCGQVVQLFKILWLPQNLDPLSLFLRWKGTYAEFKTSFYSWIPFQSESQSGQMIFQGESAKFSRTRTRTPVFCLLHPFPSMNEVSGFRQSEQTQVWLTEHPEHHPFAIPLTLSGFWTVNRTHSLLLYEARSKMLLFPIDFPLT